MHSIQTPDQTLSANSRSSSVLTSPSTQNTGKKRNHAENISLSSKTKRTPKDNTPLSDITNITILESSPFSTSCASAEVPSLNSCTNSHVPNESHICQTNNQFSTFKVRARTNSTSRLVRLRFYL